MSAFTAKTFPAIKNAPRRITLLGDKTRRPEPAQHVIEFPGGAVEVSRTEDGCYWAHVIINRAQVVDDTQGRESALGHVVGARIDCDAGVLDMPHADTATQFAVLIKPVVRGAA